MRHHVYAHCLTTSVCAGIDKDSASFSSFIPRPSTGHGSSEIGNDGREVGTRTSSGLCAKKQILRLQASLSRQSLVRYLHQKLTIDNSITPAPSGMQPVLKRIVGVGAAISTRTFLTLEAKRDAQSHQLAMSHFLHVRTRNGCVLDLFGVSTFSTFTEVCEWTHGPIMTEMFTAREYLHPHRPISSLLYCTRRAYTL